MPRDPRYIPRNSLQHVVDTTFQNRYLLRPAENLNRIFTGVLAKAQQRHEMKICAVFVASSHVHLLLQPKDGAQLAAFMCFLKTNLAKEIGTRLHDWRGRFFARRFHTTSVSEEEEAQVKVLRYILSHGVKEHLVDSVRQWPGIHSAQALIDGSSLDGRWHDRTSEYRARGRRGSVDAEDFASNPSVTLSPLPCWQHLPEAKWRQAVKEMVEDIDQTAAEQRHLGIRSLGAAKVLAMDPRHQPSEVESSPQPRFHVASKKHLMQLLEAFGEVFAAFRSASDKLRAGDRTAIFPAGTFPPALPFIPFPTEPPIARGQPT